MDIRDHTHWLDLDYVPKLPKDKSVGIGIVGAGAIVEFCHLPTYQMADFNVIGIYDINRDRAETLARQFRIPHVSSSLNELLESIRMCVWWISPFQQNISRRLWNKRLHEGNIFFVRSLWANLKRMPNGLPTPWNEPA